MKELKTVIRGQCYDAGKYYLEVVIEELCSSKSIGVEVHRCGNPTLQPCEMRRLAHLLMEVADKIDAAHKEARGA